MPFAPASAGQTGLQLAMFPAVSGPTWRTLVLLPWHQPGKPSSWRRACIIVETSSLVKQPGRGVDFTRRKAGGSGCRGWADEQAG